MKTKGDLRRALARIMELAKVHRDLSFLHSEQSRWDEILDIADDALDNPTVADIDRYLKNEPRQA